MQRDIQKVRLHFQEPPGDLLFGGHLNVVGRGVLGGAIVGNPLRAAQSRHIPPGPESGELVQHIPPQTVDGGGGQGQSRRNLHGGFHAPVGSAPGFGQPGNEYLPGQLCNPGSLRGRALGGADPVLGVNHRQLGKPRADHRLKADGNQGRFPGFVGLAQLLEKGGIFPGVLPDAEHFLSQSAVIIALGKALAVEGVQKGLFHVPGHHIGVQGLPINPGDRRYVLRPLHPSLQLQGGNAHLFQPL